MPADPNIEQNEEEKKDLLEVEKPLKLARAASAPELAQKGLKEAWPEGPKNTIMR